MRNILEEVNSNFVGIQEILRDLDHRNNATRASACRTCSIFYHLHFE